MRPEEQTVGTAGERENLQSIIDELHALLMETHNFLGLLGPQSGDKPLAPGPIFTMIDTANDARGMIREIREHLNLIS